MNRAERSGALRGEIWDTVTDYMMKPGAGPSATTDRIIDLFRDVLDEIALSFDSEAATHYELAEVARARQAEAAATYVRIVRDMKFPKAAK